LDYNKRKITVLAAMAELGEARARELMEYLGDIELEAAKKCLTRYYRQGLLSREWGLYKMSERGYERLEYLQDIMQ